jgi:NAD(P)-dependent dehydrogenase (short-subunit alcohol dehydrogenase family)
MTQTVVITGASAGIARATARLYGARGASVGLIARGQVGLDGAAEDVIEAGGQALAIPADVADHAQVEKAATEIEAQFGPIDVWINVAFTSVFAPFAEIGPDEFRRVTEVSYWATSTARWWPSPDAAAERRDTCRSARRSASAPSRSSRPTAAPSTR